MSSESDFEAPALNVIELINQGPEILEKKRKALAEFEARLSSHWRLPLDRLDLLISIGTEAISRFDDEFRNAAWRDDDWQFKAMRILSIKACRTSLAIARLLRSGFADDAMSRWRLLHEISVYVKLIRNSGQELAERYILHDFIQMRDWSNTVLQHGNDEGSSFVSSEFDDVDAISNTLIAQFGPNFGSTYGWVNPKRRSTFRQIEKMAGLENRRSEYKMANDTVHANVRGLYLSLSSGLNPNPQPSAAPSVIGLSIPANCTIDSFTQIVADWLSTRKSQIRAKQSKELQGFADETKSMLTRVDENLARSNAREY